MNKNTINIYDLETDIKYDNYLLEVDNLNYINYRCSFNKYLKRFINKCQKLHIKIFFVNNNKFNILNKQYIIDQINYLKNNIVKSHIELLTNMMLNNEINTIEYISVNNEIILKNQNKLNNYDDFIYLTNIIYTYKLLEIDEYKNFNIDFQKEYSNLVNLSSLTNNFYKNKIILIDEYSTSN